MTNERRALAEVIGRTEALSGKVNYRTLTDVYNRVEAVAVAHGFDTDELYAALGAALREWNGE